MATRIASSLSLRAHVGVGHRLVGQRLTTQQTAVLLNVSRQYLVRFLDEKRISFTKTGKHRRLQIEDVLSFKDNRERNRHAGMRALSQVTQEFGGYDAEVK